jgi:hypothetical protein
MQGAISRLTCRLIEYSRSTQSKHSHVRTETSFAIAVRNDFAESCTVDEVVPIFDVEDAGRNLEIHMQMIQIKYIQ